VDAQGLLHHVNGSGEEPQKPLGIQRKVVGEDGLELIVEVPADEADWEDRLKTWKRGEAVIKQQIAATILDSLFMKVQRKETALEIWKVLSVDFQNKSWMVSVDL
jgi:hypothetical protein